MCEVCLDSVVMLKAYRVVELVVSVIVRQYVIREKKGERNRMRNEL